MKIIDLLNKKVNDEEVPDKVKWEDTIYYYSKLNKSYYTGLTKDGEGIGYTLLNDMSYDIDNLNDEVEIIEEDKKIARLNQDNFQCVSNLEVSGQSANYFEYGIEDEIRDIVDKINEIIDYLMENKQ